MEALHPLGIAVPISLLFLTSLLAVFAAILSHSIDLQLRSSFLTINGDDPNLNCLSVPITVSGIYEGSLDGLWNTEPGFNQNTSFFELNFEGSSITVDEFSESMAKLSEKWKLIGSALEKRSRLHNLLAMNSVGFEDKQTKMSLNTNANLGIAFDREVTLAVLSNRRGVCVHGFHNSTFLSGRFDQAARALQLTIPLPIVPEYLENVYKTLADKKFSSEIFEMNSCHAQILRKNFVSNEWKSILRDGEVRIAFDVAAFSMAILLNFGQIDKSGLLENTIFKYAVEGMVAYIDPWFNPPMSPVYCLQKSHQKWNLTIEQINGPDVCFVASVGGLSNGDLYYPAFGQFWVDESQCPQYEHNNTTYQGSCRRRLCECPFPIGQNDYSKFCNQENYFFGFIAGNLDRGAHDDDYSPDAPNLNVIVQLGLKLQRFLIDDPADGDLAAIQALAPILSYSLNIARAPATSHIPITSWQKPSSQISHRENAYFNNSWAAGRSYDELLEDAWDGLCPSCSGIVFEELTGLTIINQINKYGLTYEEIARKNAENVQSNEFCGDTFSNSETLAALKRTPPTELVYPYYKCSKKLSNAFWTVIGSSLAATSFLMNVAWLLGGLVLFAWLKRSNMPNKYSLLHRSDREELNAAYEQLKQDLQFDYDGMTVRVLERLAEENSSLRSTIMTMSGSNAKEISGPTYVTALQELKILHKHKRDLLRDDGDFLVKELALNLGAQSIYRSSASPKISRDVQKSEKRIIAAGILQPNEHQGDFELPFGHVPLTLNPLGRSTDTSFQFSSE